MFDATWTFPQAVGQAAPLDPLLKLLHAVGGGIMPAAVAAGLGLVLLFFGVKLVRLIWTLVFVVLGALIGLTLVGTFGAKGTADYMPQAAAAVGAIVLGLFGFLMYRFWTMLATAGLLAAVAGGVFLGVSPQHRAELTKSWEQLKTVPQVLTAETKSTEDSLGQLAQRADAAADILAKSLRGRAAVLFCLSALGGFVLGLLLGAISIGAAAVLLTSLVGVALLAGGSAALLERYQADWLDRLQGLGAKALLPLAGLWLIGVAIQIALARRRGQSPPGGSTAAPPAPGR